MRFALKTLVHPFLILLLLFAFSWGQADDKVNLVVPPESETAIDAKSTFLGDLSMAFGGYGSFYIESDAIVEQVEAAQEILRKARSQNGVEQELHLLPWYRLDGDQSSQSTQNSKQELDAANVIYSAYAHTWENQKLSSFLRSNINQALFPDALLTLALLETYPTNLGREIYKKKQAMKTSLLSIAGFGIGVIGIFNMATSFPLSFSYAMGDVTASIGNEIAQVALDISTQALGPAFVVPGTPIPLTYIKYISIQTMLRLSQQSQLLYDVHDNLTLKARESSGSQQRSATILDEKITKLSDEFEFLFDAQLVTLAREITGLEKAKENGTSLEILSTFVVHQDNFKLFQRSIQRLRDDAFLTKLVGSYPSGQRSVMKKEILYLITQLDALSSMHNQIASSANVQKKLASFAPTEGLDPADEASSRSERTLKISNFLIKELIRAFDGRFKKVYRYEGFDEGEFAAIATETHDSWLEAFEKNWMSQTWSSIRDNTYGALLGGINRNSGAAVDKATEVGKQAAWGAAKGVGKGLYRGACKILKD